MQAGQDQGSHTVAFQSFWMLFARARQSHMVFRTSFPSLSTKHWPVKTLMVSAGTGWEVEESMAEVSEQC